MKIRKKLALLLTLAMIITLSAPVYAQETGATGDSKVFESGDMMQLDASARIKVEPEQVQISNENRMERQYNGEQYTVSGGLTSGAYAVSDADNTDPNYAWLVSNNTVYQGSIVAASEMRWYAFILNQKSKVSIELQTVSSLDADIYMFSLDGSTLNLIDGSANTGAGVTEFYNNVLDAGTYFFAVAGYQGTGAFAFAYYESTADANKEVNDSIATATPVSLNTTITGVIDNPHDMDYYKLTVMEPMIIKYGLTTTSGYTLAYMAATGNGAGIYQYSGSPYYEFSPGVYYFAVRSNTGNYSSTGTYTVKFQKIAKVAVDSLINVVYISAAAGIVFQSNNLGMVYYVNGNPIDISYSYHKVYNFPEGLQDYSISIEPGDDVWAVISEQDYRPEVLQYHSSTMPAMQVGDQAVLNVTFSSNRAFYKIRCTCTGAFADNYMMEDTKAVSVLIDPASGKLVDILEFNYFYDFAIGSNNISFGRPYADFTAYKLN